MSNVTEVLGVGLMMRDNEGMKNLQESCRGVGSSVKTGG